MATFFDLARRLVHGQGISIHPVVPGGKAPGKYQNGRWFPMDGTPFKVRLPTEEELNLWGSWPDPGIAVVCSPLSGIVGVDFDNHPELHAALASFLPDTPVKKKGKKGLTWFYQHSGEINKGWQYKGEKVVELLAEHSCIIPPGVHPEEINYEWVGLGLSEIDISTLPVLPPEVIQRFDAFFAALNPPKPAPAPQAPQVYSPRPDDYARAEEAITYISADLNHDDWTKVGMAIHSAFPGENGFNLWDRWSRGSEKYQKRGNAALMRSKWRSFKPGAVTLSTLFFMAKEKGWSPYSAPLPSLDFISPGGNLKPTPAAPAIVSRDEHDEIDPSSPLALPETLVTSAPGLVGAISEWINLTTTRPQPHFALAAAIAFIGALKGHRVQTVRRARTNHYTLAIGRSGSGKSEVNSKINDLIRCAGLTHLRMGRPKSDSAIQTALIGKNGRAYLPWDEMGVHLEMMLSKNAPAHYAGIRAFLLEAWSASSDILAKSEYATAENQKGQQDIDQPCLSIFANAQPEIFYGALSSASSSDGFIPRLLIFETINNYPDERDIPYLPPPDDIVGACREIEEWPTNAKAGKGNMESLIINPRVVAFSPRAEKLILAAGRDIECKLRKYEGSAVSGIWSRAMLHIHKLALTVEEGFDISAESASWAIELMMALSPAMCAAFSLRVSDSQAERTKKKVLQIIAATGSKGIGANLLTRRTQFLRDRRERDVVLSELHESGQITPKEDPLASGRSVVRWYLTALAP